MRLVEQHIIKSNNVYYKELMRLCGLSKNLYNATLYAIRQHYFKTKSYLPYHTINKIFKETNNVDYRALQIQSSQQTMKMLDSSYKSYFELCEMKKKGLYDGKVKPPKYLKKNGHYTIAYTNQQLGKKILNGIIRVPGTNIKFYTNKRNIKQVRFVPKTSYIIMEVVYGVKSNKLKEDNKRYCSIDLGINNLATVTSNVMKPYIINGKPIKSINQYYNKRKAEFQSKLEKLNNLKDSKRIQRMSLKRRNKIKDYFHKTTTYIVNQLVSNSINTVIIGYNEDWKQDINMGKENNQNFTSISHLSFVNMIRYKCELNGINAIKREESYTSKASFIDGDYIPTIKKHEPAYSGKFSGKRIKRGLYKSKNGSYINADVNGSYNIMRKEVGDVEILADRGFVFNPIKIKIKF